jgi:hypothetical protein
MPDMLAVVKVVTFGANQVADIRYEGEVFAGQTDQIGPIQWNCNMSRSASAGQAKTTIRAAVEQAVVAFGIAIAGSDQIMVVGGPA